MEDVSHDNLLSRPVRDFFSPKSLEKYRPHRLSFLFLRLERSGMKTVGDVVRHTRDELRSVPFLGGKSIALIEKHLAMYGLNLASPAVHY